MASPLAAGRRGRVAQPWRARPNPAGQPCAARRGRALGQAGLAEDQKGAVRRKAIIVFWDESGISLTPVVRSTWAPKGRTPVLRHPFNWKRASMAAALCIRPDGGGSRLAFHLQPGSYDTGTLVVALDQLRRFLAGEKATLIWDGLPAHRSRKMGDWISQQRSWLVVERLPAYAPDLNPVEGLWSSLKAWSWPTSPASTSASSSPLLALASTASAAPRTWPTGSSTAAD
jgi:transposase